MNTLEAFVEEATVEMENGSDPRAVGAAVTVELCGHWEHDGACRWPHHTSVREKNVRTIFACKPEEADEVRRRVVAGMKAGALVGGPKGPSAWKTVRVDSDDLLADEQELANRLTRL